jgi:hypothetical protein
MIKRNKHRKLGTGVFNRKTGHVFFLLGESPTEWCVKSTALRSEEWWSKMWVKRMISLGVFGLIDTVLDGSIEAGGALSSEMNHQEIDEWFANRHASVYGTQSV